MLGRLSGRHGQLDNAALGSLRDLDFGGRPLGQGFWLTCLLLVGDKVSQRMRTFAVGVPRIALEAPCDSGSTV